MKQYIYTRVDKPSLNGEGDYAPLTMLSLQLSPEDLHLASGDNAKDCHSDLASGDSGDFNKHNVITTTKSTDKASGIRLLDTGHTEVKTWHSLPVSYN